MKQRHTYNAEANKTHRLRCSRTIIIIIIIIIIIVVVVVIIIIYNNNNNNKAKVMPVVIGATNYFMITQTIPEQHIRKE
jgi:flagellar basal body-associated protein FliL